MLLGATLCGRLKDLAHDTRLDAELRETRVARVPVGDPRVLRNLDVDGHAEA